MNLKHRFTIYLLIAVFSTSIFINPVNINKNVFFQHNDDQIVIQADSFSLFINITFRKAAIAFFSCNELNYIFFILCNCIFVGFITGIFYFHVLSHQHPPWSKGTFF